MARRFDPSIPRKMYWGDEAGGCSRCPDCGEPLERDRQSYVVAKDNPEGEMEASIVGTDSGHFCASCPVVVMETGHFTSFAEAGLGWQSDEPLVVVGIVDMDAVPEEKRSAPFREPDNPVPLVQFTYPPEERAKTGKPAGGAR